MSEWAAIETAPKDGTIVDLWMQSIFVDADGVEQVAVEMRIPDAMWFDGGWCNMDGNWHDYLEGFTNMRFTHWRFLPPPPAPIEDAPK